MNWVTWVIPVIALAVWILVNLLKVPQDRDKPAARRQPPPPPRPNPPATAPGGPRTDLDRFIEEANRRRRQQEQQRKATRAPQPSQSAEPSAQEKWNAAFPRVQPDRSVGPRPPALPPAHPIPVIPVVRSIPAARPTAVVPVRVDAGARPPAEVVPAYQPGSIDAEGFTTPPTSQSAYTQQRRPGQLAGSAAARDVLRMLRDANSARAAIILREILDRPVALRGKRGS